MRGAAWLSALALIAPTPAGARTFLTQQQALAAAFPSGTTPQREAHFLTPAQLERAKRLSEGAAAEELVVRYAGLREGRIVGYAYFDSHRVRTLGETLMVVVSPEGEVAKVELLSFDEPPDYQPRRRWLDQIHGQRLDEDLSLTGAVRPISGASLTARAIVRATRKVLALHQVLAAVATPGPTPP